ncbi:hypothetical protein EV424DRAFT_1301967, partial [Suillus variegatus]
VKCILCHITGTRDFILTVGRKLNSSVFFTYCDSDFMNSPDHGQSVSGYAIMIGKGIFSWSTKKQ